MPQFSVAVRNGMLDAYETTIGTGPLLRLRTGAAPANCAAARSGTILATMTLPSDWMQAAASGQKLLNGTWQTTGLAAAGAGTNVGHYEIMDSGGTTCHEQGTVTVTGGGGDLTLDNTNVAQNQTVTITSMTKIAGNA